MHREVRAEEARLREVAGGGGRGRGRRRGGRNDHVLNLKPYLHYIVSNPGIYMRDSQFLSPVYGSRRKGDPDLATTNQEKHYLKCSC